MYKFPLLRIPAGMRVALSAMLLLGACAPVRVRENPAALALQSTRETTLAKQVRWTIVARIAVSNGSDGGSGELQWRRAGSDYWFTVRAPVTGKTWKLSGNATHAVLEGVDPQPDTDSDPERLLREHLGWDVPLNDLAAWVRGMRAPGIAASVQYDEQNRPAVIEQAGWKIEYRDWFADRDPALPRKVFASRGTARVRVAISQWSFND